MYWECPMLWLSITYSEPLAEFTSIFQELILIYLKEKNTKLKSFSDSEFALVRPLQKQPLNNNQLFKDFVEQLGIILFCFIIFIWIIISHILCTSLGAYEYEIAWLFSHLMISPIMFESHNTSDVISHLYTW